MISVYTNSGLHDHQRRNQLYQGNLFLYSARESTRALCEFARQMCEEAFAPLHPVSAQFELEPSAYHDILRTLKPAFIHHPTSKELVRALLEDFGCDQQRTFFDVPRLRTSTSDGYLTSGLAYAFQPHRDTWYSPPMCQLNWWLPVYEISPENTIAFHPQYWDKPVVNTSSTFNYQDWQQNGRVTATTFSRTDTREQSRALETLSFEDDLRLVPETDGLLIFSAAHLHSTVPNTSGGTRISIDFRTVHLDDLNRRSGAPNLDSACTGTTIRDYLGCKDFEPLPEPICAEFELETRPASRERT